MKRVRIVGGIRPDSICIYDAATNEPVEGVLHMEIIAERDKLVKAKLTFFVDKLEIEGERENLATKYNDNYWPPSACVEVQKLKDKIKELESAE